MLQTLAREAPAPISRRCAKTEIRPRLAAALSALDKPANIAWLLLFATLAIRLPSFGDPNYHIDESFYLLFGERMQAGSVPYEDIWDRKPAGLFALYWLFAGLGGVVAVHIAAILASWGTAICIAQITNIMTGTRAAALAGISYLAMQQVFHGGGGQAPVFYNGLMAAAALLALRRLLGKNGARAAYGAMLLCGLSLTIKPTTLFEGVLFGICLVLYRYRDSASLIKAIRHALLLMLIAAAPTLVILAAFAATGQLANYWFATIESVFLVTPPPWQEKVGRLALIGILAGLLLFTAVLGIVTRLPHDRKNRIALWFLTAWLTAGGCGVFALANFHSHFMLSWLVPLTVAAGLYFDRPRIGPVVGLCVIAYPLILAGYPQFDRVQTSRRNFDAATELIRPLLRDGCLYAYEAPPMLYHSTGSCLPTSRIFPEHLNNRQEARATGIDATTEVRRILSRRPTVIAISETSNVFAPNAATRELVMRAVKADYRSAGRFRFPEVSHSQEVYVYALKNE